MTGRKATYIPGMDELMNGGFPEGTINLITGPPGSAKSLFGIEYIHNGARFDNEPGMLISLEESRDSMIRAARSFDLDLRSLEKEDRIYLIDLGRMRVECSASEELEWGLASFDTLKNLIQNQITLSGAKRLVLDSVTAMAIYYSSSELFRRELLKFSRFLRDAGITTILISEADIGACPGYGIEGFVADSMIEMDYMVTAGEYHRTLTVRKMRFTKHDPLKHPFLIMENGIEVSPDEVMD
ncbi:MAG: hypothetical protein JW939_08160 [Candidatus Thermoplasmatota archaeon]|nr:hypothetical protein [Candidatus Thermoplasmatota archaeon]